MSIVSLRAVDHYSRIAEEATELRREADRIKRRQRIYASALRIGWAATVAAAVLFVPLRVLELLA